MNERSPEKKHYTTPELDTEEVFGTLSLACCKTSVILVCQQQEGYEALTNNS